MSVLTDFADKLSSGGVGTPGKDIFEGYMPAGPDDLMGLFLTGGPPPVHAMGRGPGGAVAERPHVQIISRATRPDSALFTIQKAYLALDKLGPVTINGVIYRSIFALQSPFYIYTDESSRYHFGVNFEATRDPATSS